VRSLETVQSKEANDHLNRLLKTIGSLERSLGVPRGAELAKQLEAFAREITNAATLSRPDELLQTVSEKARRLRVQAEGRRWQNLARMLQRFEARARELQLNLRVESPLVRYMESDLTATVALIKNSALDEADKNEVLKQLEGIRQETQMLLELHQARRGQGDIGERTEEALAKWVARAELAVGGLEAQARERNARVVAWLWATFAFLAVGWALVSAVSARAQAAQLRASDERLNEVLARRVYEGDASWLSALAPQRRDEIAHALKNLKKRLPLGEEFALGLPFAAALINHERQLAWANELFCEQFGLEPEDLEHESRAWESIEENLVTNERGAIERALHDAAPGVWQVKWKMPDGVTVPLELHVAPVAGKKPKLLVVFYPLAFVQDAIVAQGQLLLAPIREAFAALEAEAWGVEAEARLKEQWSQVGLSQEWERFARTIHRMNEVRGDLLSQAQLLESERHDLLKEISDRDLAFQERGQNLLGRLSGLRDIRDALVSLDQLTNEFGIEHSALVAESRHALKRGDALLEATRSLSERLSQAKDSISHLEKTKAAYRDGKQVLADLKKGLVRAFNLFLGELSDITPAGAAQAAELKELLITLDRTLSSLDQSMAGFDVQITKLAMVTTGPVPSAERLVLELVPHERVARELLEAMREDQELIIAKLQELVQGLKSEAHECLKWPQQDQQALAASAQDLSEFDA